MYLLGYDIGSSSIKAALVSIADQRSIDIVRYPEQEMEIIAEAPGWAEQEPESWWEYLVEATKKLMTNNPEVDPVEIKGIGISYQMHGLVLVDKSQQVLRPSIIWCDSRAVAIGDEAFEKIGEQNCLASMLNSPGNFTASKLKWVKDNEPEIFDRIYKFMLPGDFIAMKMTNKITTTISGLSEGIMWDFKRNEIAHDVLNHFGIPTHMVPDIVPTFGDHGRLTASMATELGLTEGIPVSYRAGDQPNNALSLGVFNPGEVAATGGTSGVVYGIADKPSYDQRSRINAFAHVNHTSEQQRIGVLLCINGAGIQYSWLKQQLATTGTSYDDMERQIQEVSVGADGLRVIPFGNGAERILENKDIGASIVNINFNRHNQSHIFRASIEGIAFSFIYGIELLKAMGMSIERLRVGNDNLFQSKVFSETIANLLGCPIHVISTTGAVGAAKAAGIGAGIFEDFQTFTKGLKIIDEYFPKEENTAYKEAYKLWKNDLEKHLM